MDVENLDPGATIQGQKRQPEGKSTRAQKLQDCLKIMKDYLDKNPVDKAKVEAHSKKIKNSKPNLTIVHLLADQIRESKKSNI
jgi:hypothetical protein